MKAKIISFDEVLERMKTGNIKNICIVDFFNGSSLCILSCFNLFPDHFRLLLFSFGTCATFRMDI